MKKRHMKKWIPAHPFYCYNMKDGQCKWLIDLTNSKDASKLRERYCDCKQYCDIFTNDASCNNCIMFKSDDGTIYPEVVTYCAYMKVFQVGQYPLGDRCKICEEHLKLRNYKYY